MNLFYKGVFVKELMKIIQNKSETFFTNRKCKININKGYVFEQLKNLSYELKEKYINEFK